MEFNSNAQFLSFECEDILDEFESSYTLGSTFFQTCLDQEGYSTSQVDDTLANDKTTVDDNTDS